MLDLLMAEYQMEKSLPHDDIIEVTAARMELVMCYQGDEADCLHRNCSRPQLTRFVAIL